MHREPLVSATLFVVSFWLAVLTIVGVLHGQVRATDLLSIAYWAPPLLAPAAGIAGGLAISVLSIWLHRRYTFAALRPHREAGMLTNLGRVPIILAPLPSGDGRIERATLRMPAALANVIIRRDRLPDDFLDTWYARYSSSHPDHAALMRRLEAVLVAHAHLPATHVQDGPRNHGGRSLVEHSLLVSMLMEWNAPGFNYPVDLSRPHLALLDPNYRFDPHDPLIAIAGIAHDIGKIEAYEFAPDDTARDGPPTGTRVDHDKIGARCLARMDEFWALPGDDREVLLLTCAYYHTPHAMPMSSPKTVRSDRLHAITELLIKWDSEGSALENSQGPDIADAYPASSEPAERADVSRASHPPGMTRPPAVVAATVPSAAITQASAHAAATVAANAAGAATAVQAGQAPGLWDVIRSVLTEPGRLNSTDKRRNVGWKFQFPHLGGRTLIFLVEDMFTRTVAARADREGETEGRFTGPSVDPLTRGILRTCLDRGALYLDYEDARTRPPEMLVYNVRMYEPRRYFANEKTRREINPAGERGEHKLELASMIVLEATDTVLPELKALPDNNLVPHIHHFRVGSAGRRGHSRAGRQVPPGSTGSTGDANMPANTEGWSVPAPEDIVQRGDIETGNDAAAADIGMSSGAVMPRADLAAHEPVDTSTGAPQMVHALAPVHASVRITAALAQAAMATMGADGNSAIKVVTSGGHLLIRSDQPGLIEALGIGDQGYCDVDALLAGIRAGSVANATVIDDGGISIIRVPAAAT